MTRTIYDEVVVTPTTLAMSENSPPPAANVRFTRWQSGLIALGTLVVVYGLGLCVMLAGGAVVHALDPAKRADIFAALHNQWVVGILLGITVLWLLPPHPWAKRVVASGSREQPVQTAGGTEGGDDLVATAQLEGPEPVRWPAEERWAGTSSSVTHYEQYHP